MSLRNNVIFKDSKLSKQGEVFFGKIARLINESTGLSLRIDSYNDIYKTRDLISVAETIATREEEVSKREDEVRVRELAIQERETNDSIAQLTMPSLAPVIELADTTKVEKPAVADKDATAEKNAISKSQLEIIASGDIDKRWYYNSSAGFVIAQNLYEKGVDKTDVKVTVHAAPLIVKGSFSNDPNKTVLNFILDSEHIVSLLESIVKN